MKLTTNLPPPELLKRLTKPTEDVPSNIKSIITGKYSTYFASEGKSNVGTNIHTTVNGNDFEILTKSWRKGNSGVVPTRRKYARFTGKVNETDTGGSIIECRFQNSDVFLSYLLLAFGWILSLVLLLIAPAKLVQTGFLIVVFACITVVVIVTDMGNRNDILSFTRDLLEIDDSLTAEETK